MNKFSKASLGTAVTKGKAWGLYFASQKKDPKINLVLQQFLTSQFFIIWVILLAALISTGCSAITEPEQPDITETLWLDESGSIGQTFVARYDGLQGIGIYIESAAPGSGEISIKLREASPTGANIAMVSLPLTDIQTPGFYNFEFTPQTSSNLKSYYWILKIEGDGAVEIGTAPGNSYLDGALYQNNTPLDTHQSAFQLAYNRRALTTGLLKEGAQTLGYLLVGVFLFVIPGWALLELPGLRRYRVSRRWGVRFSVAVSISIAVYPILFLWTDFVGFHWGSIYAWGPGAVGLAYLLLRKIGQLRARKLNPVRWWTVTKKRLPVVLTLTLVIGLIFLTRFWVIRSLAAPLWGDSYHHTMITQLLIDNQGLFDDWLPYAELSTFTYHFGFHSLSACLAWITQLPTEQSVLITGQIINALAIVALFPLVQKITQNRWASVIGLLCAGLVLSIPMGYTNWGRYTQLTGQVLLPTITYLLWKNLEKKKLDRGLLAISGLLLGALALIHYRVLILSLLFIPAIWLLAAPLKNWKVLLKRTLWIGLIALGISLPWLIQTLSSKLVAILDFKVSQQIKMVISAQNPSVMLGKLFLYLPAWSWLLCALVIAWGLWKHDRKIIILCLWWFFVIVVGNTGWLGLPGEGILDVFTISIAFYIPISILMGAGLSYAIRAIQDRSELPSTAFRRRLAVVLLPGIILIGLWGANQRLSDIDPQQFALMTHPDRKAFAWMDTHLPEGTTLLVNAFFAYDDYVIVGSDGGWWIPLLSHQNTMLPPINYGFEQGFTPDYQDWINQFWHTVEDFGVNSPEALAIMQERGITHIYIGQQQGRVNYQGPVLSPQQLSADPNFTPIYHQDRTWVFKSNSSGAP